MRSPENWVPFLDSRQADKGKHDSHVYYPTELAHVCQGRITFNLLNISPDDKSVEISLAFGPVELILFATVYETKDKTFLEIIARSAIPASHYPDIEQMLLAVCTEIASNVKLLGVTHYPILCNSE